MVYEHTKVASLHMIWFIFGAVRARCVPPCELTDVQGSHAENTCSRASICM